jgi:hypothetical protein
VIILAIEHNSNINNPFGGLIGRLMAPIWAILGQSGGNTDIQLHTDHSSNQPQKELTLKGLQREILKFYFSRLRCQIGHSLVKPDENHMFIVPPHQDKLSYYRHHGTLKSESIE